MKKLLSVASGLIIGTAMLHAQGVVEFSSSSLGILTNTAGSHFAGGNETGGTSGMTGIAANGFMYQLFVQPYTGTLDLSFTNPLTGGWTVATTSGTPITATNGTRSFQYGSILGPGGLTGVAVDGWALPTNSMYSSSGREYFLIAGWSVSLGTSWEQLSDLLADNFANATAPGFFGVSTIGNSYAAGANGLSPESMFNSNGQTIQGVGAFTLYATVPEPSTTALAGLGGLSLLLFRRRK